MFHLGTGMRWGTWIHLKGPKDIRDRLGIPSQDQHNNLKNIKTKAFCYIGRANKISCRNIYLVERNYKKNITRFSPILDLSDHMATHQLTLMVNDGVALPLKLQNNNFLT